MPSSLINFNGHRAPRPLHTNPCQEPAVAGAGDTEVKDSPPLPRSSRVRGAVEARERDTSTIHNLICVLESSLPGLLWWLSGKECIYQCWRHGFDPRSGKIPHAEERLSPRTTTTEPALEPESRCCRVHPPESLRSAVRSHRTRDQLPPATTREGPHSKEDPAPPK